MPPPAPIAIYELAIELAEAKPRIWRRVQVPGNANLGWLHAVIQVAMGWTNSHMHQFQLANQTFAAPRSDLEGMADDAETLDENRVVLMEVAPVAGAMLGYEYDFGDSWGHLITVEKILPPDPAAAKLARCVDGARACPPDDCGGPPGYQHLLRILKNPKHKEHQSMKEWLGREFDPAAFDVAATDAWLRLLKWPRVTVAQLARVLMARDGYSG